MLLEERVVAELTAKLNRWVEGVPGRTWSSLGRQANVHEQVIRRLINQGSIPQTDNLISILKTVCNVRFLRDLRFHCSDDLMAYLKKRLPLVEYDQEIESQSDSNKFEILMLANPELFKLYFYILASDSVTVSQLKNDFGPKVESQLEELYSLGKIMENNDGTITSLKQVGSIAGTSKHITKALLKMLLDTHLRAEEDQNRLAVFAGNVDAATYFELMTMSMKFLRETHSLMISRPGPYPIFLGLALDSLSRSLKNELVEIRYRDGGEHSTDENKDSEFSQVIEPTDVEPQA